MCRAILIVLAVLTASLGVFYQLYGAPLLELGGQRRVIEAVGNTNCKRDKHLQACEKIVLHESGYIYAACSYPTLRTLWLPSIGNLNRTGSGKDYLALYDPSSGKTTHLALVRFKPERDTGFSSLGLDVVTSAEDRGKIWVYAINMRPPFGNAFVYGPDAVIEIFEGEVGAPKLSHRRTITDKLIGMPNDVIGSPDGKSFYITNMPKTRGPYGRFMDVVFARASTTVTYCHVDEGCKVAAEKVIGSNGIARGKDGQVYVASTFKSSVTVFDQQADNSLVLADTIHIKGGGIDNLSVDSDGTVWVAELPKIFRMMFLHMKDPKVEVPSTVRKITLNTDESAYFGEKYKVEKVFEDNGQIASGITSAAYDAKNKKLYMNGLASPALVVCDM